MGDGIGVFISTDAVQHLITSHIGNPEAGQKMIDGKRG